MRRVLVHRDVCGLYTNQTIVLAAVRPCGVSMRIASKPLSPPRDNAGLAAQYTMADHQKKKKKKNFEHTYRGQQR